MTCPGRRRRQRRCGRRRLGGSDLGLLFGLVFGIHGQRHGHGGALPADLLHNLDELVPVDGVELPELLVGVELAWPAGEPPRRVPLDAVRDDRPCII